MFTQSQRNIYSIGVTSKYLHSGVQFISDPDRMTYKFPVGKEFLVNSSSRQSVATFRIDTFRNDIRLHIGNKTTKNGFGYQKQSKVKGKGKRNERPPHCTLAAKRTNLVVFFLSEDDMTKMPVLTVGETGE